MDDNPALLQPEAENSSRFAFRRHNENGFGWRHEGEGVSGGPVIQWLHADNVLKAMSRILVGQQDIQSLPFQRRLQGRRSLGFDPEESTSEDKVELVLIHRKSSIA